MQLFLIIYTKYTIYIAKMPYLHFTISTLVNGGNCNYGIFLLLAGEPIRLL